MSREELCQLDGPFTRDDLPSNLAQRGPRQAFSIGAMALPAALLIECEFRGRLAARRPRPGENQRDKQAVSPTMMPLA